MCPRCAVLCFAVLCFAFPFLVVEGRHELFEKSLRSLFLGRFFGARPFLPSNSSGSAPPPPIARTEPLPEQREALFPSFSVLLLLFSHGGC